MAVMTSLQEILHFEEIRSPICQKWTLLYYVNHLVKLQSQLTFKHSNLMLVGVSGSGSRSLLILFLGLCNGDEELPSECRLESR